MITINDNTSLANSISQIQTGKICEIGLADFAQILNKLFRSDKNAKIWF